MQASAIKPMTLTKPGWCAGCPNHCPIVLLFKACLAFSSVIHQTYHHCACSVPRKRKINLTFSKNIKKRNLRKYINSNGYKFCYFGNPEYSGKVPRLSVYQWDFNWKGFASEYMNYSTLLHIPCSLKLCWFVCSSKELSDIIMTFFKMPSFCIT